MSKVFKTSLHVDKRIVSLLSKSTYQKSFSNTIRELVSNAYDADALSVKIYISEDLKDIEIIDDGNGMTETEFEKYLTIAGIKNTSEYSRRYKRKKIGQFGVGFLSIFPFCESLEITTTSENSIEVLNAKIPTIQYNETSNNKNVGDIPINGNITENANEKLKHYTKIKLINPTYLIEQYFSKSESKKRESIIVMEPFERFKWELQEDLPISYNIEGKSYSLLKYDEPIGINVFVNDIPIYRNELNNIILENKNELINDIECKYIFTTNYKSIKPLEARGIKIRVNNVGIGSRTEFSLKRDRGFSRLHWLSGEIHFSEAIKQYLTLSRDSFISSPVIDELTEIFAKKLRYWAQFIETVSVAEKEIEQSVNSIKKDWITPKKEIIDKNINKLIDKGFEVSYIDTQNKGNKSSISIDKQKKTIVISNQKDEIINKDHIEIRGFKYEMIFSKNFNEDDPPCRFININTIEINQNYTLFKSKTYGNLFRKFHILLLIAFQSEKNQEDVYKYIYTNFLDEFKDYK